MKKICLSLLLLKFFLFPIQSTIGQQNYYEDGKVWSNTLLLADDDRKYDQERSFSIDQIHNTFLKDGKPFRYVSGSMHYFRIPEQYWEDRLQKARQGGLNAIQTYIEWSSHQPQPDLAVDFSGNLNIFKYFELAQKSDLLVLIRPGPFIAAERDNSGLPYWLATKNLSMPFRTYDPLYIKYIEQWYDILLPKLVPYLYKNGGPIIMVQVENEYGSYCSKYNCCEDKRYMNFLVNIFRKYLGNDTLLFTTDGATDYWLKGGIENAYPTISYCSGNEFDKCFELLSNFTGGGPMVTSEYYPGSYDIWGSEHDQMNITSVLKPLIQMMDYNASVNFYMYHGGTSFGFKNAVGLPFHNNDSVVIMETSYDYDAPISEDGKLTPKYFAIREVIKKYLPVPSIDPEFLNDIDLNKDWSELFDYFDIPELNFEKNPIQIEDDPPIPVRLDYYISLFDLLNDTDSHNNNNNENLIGHGDDKIEPIESKYPLTFEEIMLAYGFIYYETEINFRPLDPVLLKVHGKLHDRCLIFINRQFQTIMTRSFKQTTLTSLKYGNKIGFLVENQGRACCEETPDLKGIVGNVTIDGHLLTNWKQYPLFKNWSMAMGLKNLMMNEKFLTEIERNFFYNNNVNDECKTECVENQFDYLPSFYIGSFKTDATKDLYIDFQKCGRKGVAFLNGYQLGHYWPTMGPQLTLYIPKYWLTPNDLNILFLFELESNKWPCFNIQLIHHQILNGTVPDPIYEKPKKICMRTY